MTTEDIERIVKLYQSVTDRDIQTLLLRLLAIEVHARGALVMPEVRNKGDA